MKKIVLSLIIVVSSFQVFSQNEENKSVDMYVAACLSTSTGDDFNQNSYPSIELGVYLKDVTVAFNTGRSNIDESPWNDERIENYYYELKAIRSFPIENVTAYVVFGWGQYYNSTHSFIEYGGGLVYPVSKKVDFMLQVSNWDNIVYLSPCVGYNFSVGRN